MQLGKTFYVVAHDFRGRHDGSSGHCSGLLPIMP